MNKNRKQNEYFKQFCINNIFPDRFDIYVGVCILFLSEQCFLKQQNKSKYTNLDLHKNKKI